MLDETLTQMQAHMVIQSCESKEELRSIARDLVECHFASKELLGRLILDQVKREATYLQDI